MTSREGRARVLSDAQIRQFIDDGFVRVDEAFPSQLADACRAILWRDLPCDPDEPKTWTRPVIRLGWYECARKICLARTANCQIVTFAASKSDNSGGLPCISDQGNSCFQNGLWGKRRRGLAYRSSLACADALNSDRVMRCATRDRVVKVAKKLRANQLIRRNRVHSFRHRS